jgi:hypothetical protein
VLNADRGSIIVRKADGSLPPLPPLPPVAPSMKAPKIVVERN